MVYEEIPSKSELECLVHNFRAYSNKIKGKKKQRSPSRVIYSHCGVHWGPTYREFLGRSPNLIEKKP